MNYKLTLCYDGTRYKGWQRQGNTDSTIQGRVENILGRITGENIEISGCGRTDAGVHALCQVCSFHSDTEYSCAELLKLLREYLPEDIGAVSLEQAPPRFHARLSCKSKTYMYRIVTGDAPCVFERKYVYRFEEKPDIDLMRMASDFLLGTHDFAAFCSLKNSKKSTVRTLERIEINENGSFIEISLTGDGFLYNMVRIIVGTLLEVGTGKKLPEDTVKILESKKRELAGATAPAQGLFLYKISY